VATTHTEDPATPAADRPPEDGPLARLLSFRVLMVASIVHSVLFTGLITCAFLLGKPEPVTFVFGVTHGIMWIVMCVASAVAAKLRTVPLTTALTVIVLGAAGPYFVTIDFFREERNRRRGALETSPAES
jgi:hypothetical protein